jgi:hypothetical protein
LVFEFLSTIPDKVIRFLAMVSQLMGTLRDGVVTQPHRSRKTYRSNWTGKVSLPFDPTPQNNVDDGSKEKVFVTWGAGSILGLVFLVFIHSTEHSQVK